MKRLLIYGANGYTGKLIVAEAVRLQLNLIVAGRNADRIREVANRYSLESRTFELDAVADQLGDVSVVLNCAGPYSATAIQFMDACINSGVHYVDLSGEISVLQYAQSRHQDAGNNHCVLYPGAGMMVPTDCMALMLQRRLPDAEQLTIAFNFGTRPSIGTLLTVIEGIKQGGLIRENHQLKKVPTAYRIRRYAFMDSARWCATIPWTDVYANQFSTGIPNCQVYVAMPLAMAVMLRATSLLSPILAYDRPQKWLKWMAQRVFPGGPSPAARACEHTQFFGSAMNRAGKTVSIQVSGTNVYELSPVCAVSVARQCLAKSGVKGFQTPATLLGGMAILDGGHFDVRTSWNPAENRASPQSS